MHGLLLGSFTWTLIYLLAALAAPGHVGGGDVKLAMICGGWIGSLTILRLYTCSQPLNSHTTAAAEVLLMVCLAVVIANVFTIAQNLVNRCLSSGSRKHEPHGPSMLLATAITICPLQC